MIIDCHIHENKYSSDSKLDFKDAIKRASAMGIDGLCITNHDNNTLRNEIGDSAIIDGLLVIVGAEILTFEGDILVFGLKDIPSEMMGAEDLLNIVKREKGAAVAAHPFRNNMRGIGNNIRRLSKLLTGVEAFNGSTLHHHNLQAFNLSNSLNIPCLGCSDSHIVEKVGSFATDFYGNIRDHKDFVEALRAGNYDPIKWDNKAKTFTSIVGEPETLVNVLL